MLRLLRGEPAVHCRCLAVVGQQRGRALHVVSPAKGAVDGLAVPILALGALGVAQHARKLANLRDKRVEVEAALRHAAGWPC